MKISVIMPSLLAPYPGSAPNPDKKFIRAVMSFMDQGYADKELIIASDGCERTNEIYKRLFCKMKPIRLLELPRHELFTGAVRQAAIDASWGSILCNLDTDDYFKKGHLASVAAGFTSNEPWAFFNHWIQADWMGGKEHLFDCDGTLERMCNANYAWRRGLPVTWNNCDGRSDNKAFIPQLLKIPGGRKIYGTGYVVTNVQIA